MSENKHYTPSIEEFHVGFEYETEENPVTGEWEKQEVASLSLKNIYSYFNDSDVECRVKFLDQEDIESLGWGYIRIEKDVLHFQKDKYTLLYDTAPLEQYGNILTILIAVSDTTRFQFSVPAKNKSELKRLMKQLNIER